MNEHFDSEPVRYHVEQYGGKCTYGLSRSHVESLTAGLLGAYVVFDAAGNAVACNGRYGLTWDSAAAEQVVERWITAARPDARIVQVVTWSDPTSGRKIHVTPAAEAALSAIDAWPHAYVQVEHGLHSHVVGIDADRVFDIERVEFDHPVRFALHRAGLELVGPAEWVYAGCVWTGDCDRLTICDEEGGTVFSARVRRGDVDYLLSNISSPDDARRESRAYDRLK